MQAEAAMRLALLAAAGARGKVFPNPAVGAVIYRGNEVLGKGRTQPPPGDHAEVQAIRHAIRTHGRHVLRGASMAVTMEPCSFTGRTGPCTDAICSAGLSSVAVGTLDPHPRVSGRGLEKLRDMGLEVREGVLESRCREHHRGFVKVQKSGRPFVSLKLATTMDGRIATRSGESRWITGEKARSKVHALRGRADAIGVGSVTARRDDPELSVRRGDKVLRRPIRLVFDSNLSLPFGNKLVQEFPESTWVICGHRANQDDQKRFLSQGVRVIRSRKIAGHLDLCKALESVAKLGLTEIFIEGGGGLAAALLKRGLVDEVHWFAAPSIIGSDGRPSIGNMGTKRLSDSLELEIVDVRRVGSDLYTRAVLK